MLEFTLTLHGDDGEDVSMRVAMLPSVLDSQSALGLFMSNAARMLMEAADADDEPLTAA